MIDRAGAAGQLWDRIIVLAELLEPADWRRPTPCPDWDVQDVVAHLPAIQHLFDGGPNPQPPEGWTPTPDRPPRDAWTEAGVVARRGWTTAQVLDDVRAARDGHVRRLQQTDDWDAPAQGPTGETTQDGLFRVRMMDLWVHLQDLHLALHEPVDAPDLSAAAEAAARYLFAALPYLFAKKIDTEEGSTMRVIVGAPLEIDAVLRIDGGRAGWDETADGGNCVIEADPAVLTLLLAGRGTPGQWREKGLLQWTGDLGEQFVHRARVAL